MKIFLLILFIYVPTLSHATEDYPKIKIINIAKAHKKTILTTKQLNDLFKNSSISKVILLYAFTSAPYDIDVKNILNIIQSSIVIPNKTPSIWPSPKPLFWQAVIVTKNETYHVSIGNKMGYVSSSKRHAYFERPSNKSLKMEL